MLYFRAVINCQTDFWKDVNFTEQFVRSYLL